jgi:phosphatidylglycerol---prolipoprotein diacylglyceryl transferase
MWRPTSWGIPVHPILLDAGPVTIYSYGVLLAAAYLLGLWLGVRRARAAGLDGNKVLDLGIWVIIAALVGAKGLLFIVDFEHFTSSWQEFTTLLRSGGVFYGGLIAAIFVCIWQLKKHRLHLWTSGDLFAPGIALGYMVGRLGCLLAGCCYGKPTDVPWAITFTNPLAANVGTPLGVHLHPTQLYEAGAELLILGFLLTIERRGRAFAGRTFWLYMLLYAISRFIIEFYRGDPRGMVLGVSTSQFISLILGPLSLAMLVYLARTTPPVPTAGVRTKRAAA